MKNIIVVVVVIFIVVDVAITGLCRESSLSVNSLVKI